MSQPPETWEPPQFHPQPTPTPRPRTEGPDFQSPPPPLPPSQPVGPPSGYQPAPGYAPPAAPLGPQGYGQPPTPPPPVKKKHRGRRVLVGLVGLFVLIIVIVSISNSGSGAKTPAGAALAGSAGGPHQATAPTSEAAPTTTAAPIPAPSVYTGTGDDVLSITKPASDGPVVATIKGNAGGVNNFAVQGMDGDKDLLVNTTDPYSGSTLMDIQGGTTTQLQVTATGPWSITLSDPRSAPALNPGANSGTGDTVLVYRGGTSKAAITGGTGVSNFAVIEYNDSGENLMVNETNPYQGTVPLAAGPAIVAVTATGPWSMAVG